MRCMGRGGAGPRSLLLITDQYTDRSPLIPPTGWTRPSSLRPPRPMLRQHQQDGRMGRGAVDVFSFSLSTTTKKKNGPPFLLVSPHPTTHQWVWRTADGQLEMEEVWVEELKCINS